MKRFKFSITGNQINEFLWSCAGVNKQILRLYPSDWAKYAGNGGTILFTAVMAMISGGYAMFFVFNSYIIAMAFALVWALLIFNLDRFIVNSMYTDGKDSITWRKFRAALPRFILATFIGIVISTPLEMKIFEDRINAQLLKDNIERVNTVKDKQGDYKQQKLLQDEYKALKDQRNKLTTELQEAQKDLKQEAEGTALSGKVGHGAIYKDKEIYVKQCESALQEWDSNNKNRLDNLEQQINNVNQNITVFENKVKDVREDGFAARYEAFSNLRDGNRSLDIVAWMISLLFIIIEITPTFFKMVLIEGPYQTHINAEKEKQKMMAKQEVYTAETNLKIAEMQNDHRVEEEEQILAMTLDPVQPKKKVLMLGASQESKRPEPKQVPYKEQKQLKAPQDTMVIRSKKKQEPKFKTNNKGQIVMDFRPGHN